MAKIALLNDTVTSQIAAGEVIERPAAIVREMLDNSIDAGAKEIFISVTIQDDDLSILVKDDGSGIAPDELDLAFVRHATSKIKTFEDIYSSASLGFRGEALASIASVSHVEALSCDNDRAHGSRIFIEGGVVTERGTASLSRGTSFHVKNIFYNTPVRKKFLKNLIAEKSEIKKEIIAHAIAATGIGFTFQSITKNENKTELRIPAGWSLKDRIAYLFGKEIASSLIEIIETRDGVKLTGYISNHQLQRSTRREQFFIIKGRVVKNSTLETALRNSYANILPHGKNPACFLTLEASGSDVDMNVHPAKKEVRFRDTESIYRLVYHSVKEKLYSGFSSTPAEIRDTANSIVVNDFLTVATDYNETDSALNSDDRFSDLPTTWLKSFTSTPENSNLETHPLEPQRPIPLAKFESPSINVIGQYAQSYILFEQEGSLYIVDQHAIAERINYEIIKQKLASRTIEKQLLLVPILIETSIEIIDFVEKNQSVFNELGLDFEPFGQTTLKLEELPMWVPKRKEGDSIRTYLEELYDNKNMNKTALLDEGCCRAACRMSIMAGKLLEKNEMTMLIEKFYEMKIPPVCPHGRPAIKKLAITEIEKWFQR